ncbi:MAG TPA: biotin--[acetyl-CoA-carboxylase] ligase [Caldilineae bacterium]|nr:biotin--[acetyl-CoA-carboxylase] ligase [Caldilineae bacterium]
MDQLDLRTLASRLDTRRIGHPLVYAPRLSSTQALAGRLADLGWPEGTTVLAEEQTAGRGRLGRTWWSPYAQALLLSLLLRPRWPPHLSQRLVMAASLAAAEAIEISYEIPVALKWPNDIYVQGRKAGGILVEARLTPDGGLLESAIVGIGINVTVDFAQHPELQVSAISLHTVAECRVDRGALLVALLGCFEQRYQEILDGCFDHTAWARRLLWIGEEVRVTLPDGTLTGIAQGVDDEGALLVQTAEGQIERILAGDLSLRREDQSAAGLST